MPGFFVVFLAGPLGAFFFLSGVRFRGAARVLRFAINHEFKWEAAHRKRTKIDSIFRFLPNVRLEGINVF